MCATGSFLNKPRTRDTFVKWSPSKLRQGFFKYYSRFCCVIDDQTLLAGMATWLSLLMYYVLLRIRISSSLGEMFWKARTWIFGGNVRVILKGIYEWLRFLCHPFRCIEEYTECNLHILISQGSYNKMGEVWQPFNINEGKVLKCCNQAHRGTDDIKMEF